MLNNQNRKRAGELLVYALRNKKTGFITRVSVPPALVSLAYDMGRCRRAMAKLTNQSGYRDYARATEEPTDERERARICTERRGILAELVIGGLFDLSGAKDYALQPLVSHTSEPGADVRLDGLLYDIKAAGQLSAEWSAGPEGGSRLEDDNNISINHVDHCDYLMEVGAAGYISVYFYIENGVPVAADIFFNTMEQVSALPIRYPRNCWKYGNKDMRYRLLPLSFPDERQSEGFEQRMASVLRAGFHPKNASPFTPLARAA